MSQRVAYKYDYINIMRTTYARVYKCYKGDLREWENFG